MPYEWEAGAGKPTQLGDRNLRNNKCELFSWVCVAVAPWLLQGPLSCLPFRHHLRQELGLRDAHAAQLVAGALLGGVGLLVAHPLEDANAGLA
eukprot:10113635-Alexandrium_andersonii.AAC.1